MNPGLPTGSGTDDVAIPELSALCFFLGILPGANGPRKDIRDLGRASLLASTLTARVDLSLVMTISLDVTPELLDRAISIRKLPFVRSEQELRFVAKLDGSTQGNLKTAFRDAVSMCFSRAEAWGRKNPGQFDQRELMRIRHIAERALGVIFEPPSCRARYMPALRELLPLYYRDDTEDPSQNAVRSKFSVEKLETFVEQSDALMLWGVLFRGLVQDIPLHGPEIPGLPRAREMLLDMRDEFMGDSHGERKF